jgi:hypothetical protein
MSFDNEASNRDNDAALDALDAHLYTAREEYDWACEWLEDSEWAAFDEDPETVDGCVVEPDGTCPHGYRSPMLVLGII